MRVRRVGGLVLAAVVIWALVAPGKESKELAIGDPAPPLSLGKWVKGEPVTTLDPNGVYVVEFWATWCGPCRTSIPHLTELQKEHPDATVIGVSIWEDDRDDVEPFVKEMGDQMDYRVAVDQLPEGADPEKGEMSQSWMTAADQHGIPTAFLIKDGKIAWIGHPQKLEKPLEQALSGNYDFEAAAREQRQGKERQRKLIALMPQLNRALRGEDRAEALTALDKMIATDTDSEETLGPFKFKLLWDSGKGSEAIPYGSKLVDSIATDNAQSQFMIARTILDTSSPQTPSPEALQLALKAAERTNELTKGENPMVLDTLAQAHFRSGEAALALECEEKAVKLSPTANPERNDRLEQYRKAAREPSAEKSED